MNTKLKDTPIVPDFVSVVELVTFHANTIPQALREMALWLEQNELSESDEISCIEVSQDNHGDGFRASVTGITRNGVTIKELLGNA